jgi:lactoylglutathione lyase
MMNRDMKGLAHIGIYTDDIEKSMKFYTDILGFDWMDKRDVPVEGGTMQLGFVSAGNLVIELIQPVDTSVIKERKAGIVDHIAIEVEDIDDVIIKLKEKNLVFNSEEKKENPYLFDGISNIFFDGPNGERLELFQYNK